MSPTKQRFASILSILLSGAMVLGCQPDDKGDTAAAPMCSEVTDCDECLMLEGCNWTGDTCADMCLQDTDCYGPGNPSAPMCPGPEAEPTTASEAKECEAADDCAACLDLEGCNWSADICSDVCLQDAPCRGPDNPAAPTCSG